MRTYKPRAYEQGDLDLLCGLYAVVNAVRHTLGPCAPFRGRDCLWLFGALVERLDKKKLLARALVRGMTSRQVSLLLRESRSLVAARHGFTFDVVRPLARARVRRVPQLERFVRRSLGPGTVVLMRFTDHWSVVRYATRTSLRLLDSAGYRRVRYDELLLRRPRRPADRDKDYVLPAVIYLLRYRAGGGPETRVKARTPHAYAGGRRRFRSGDGVDPPGKNRPRSARLFDRGGDQVFPPGRDGQARRRAPIPASVRQGVGTVGAITPARRRVRQRENFPGDLVSRIPPYVRFSSRSTGRAAKDCGGPTRAY